MNIIQQNIQNINKQIYTSALNYDRNPKQISLIAVSKANSISAIEYAIEAGQYDFGENYIQESLKKIIWFRHHYKKKKINWHFIGIPQFNKSRFIAEYFDWCHTINSARLAYNLNNKRSNKLEPLNVLIQINFSDRQTRSGIYPNELLTIAKFIQSCPNLKLRGLMVITEPKENFNDILKIFKHTATLYYKLQNIYHGIDTLSMGMTQDMIAAIAAGSTLLRIGTAIFGTRKYNTNILNI